jgi:hypothetical protein
MTHPALIQKYSDIKTDGYKELLRNLRSLAYPVFERNFGLNTSIESALNDFVSDFVESLLKSDPVPRNADEAELLAWMHQSAVNKVQVNGRGRRIIELRAISFCQKLAKGNSRELIEDYATVATRAPSVEGLDVTDNFKHYLANKGWISTKRQCQLLRFLELRLQGLRRQEICQEMGLTIHEGDLLQQGLAHHYKRFVEDDGAIRAVRIKSDAFTGVIKLVSPNGNLYEVHSDNFAKFGRQVGLRVKELESLAVGRAGLLKGWRLTEESIFALDVHSLKNESSTAEQVYERFSRYGIEEGARLNKHYFEHFQTEIDGNREAITIYRDGSVFWEHIEFNEDYWIADSNGWFGDPSTDYPIIEPPEPNMDREDHWLYGAKANSHCWIHCYPNTDKLLQSARLLNVQLACTLPNYTKFTLLRLTRQLKHNAS